MAHSRLYVQIMNSARWKTLRATKLVANPFCERCEAEGYVRPARCVHHIIEVESGRTEQECRDLAFRWSNLQSLCYQHHAEIHAAERSHSKEAHKQREDDRLTQWMKRHRPDGGGEP